MVVSLWIFLVGKKYVRFLGKQQPTQIRNLASKFEKVYNAERIVSLLFFGVGTSSIICKSLKYFPSATWRI